MNISVVEYLNTICNEIPSQHIDGLLLGCINTRSVNNKATTQCRTIVDEQLDVLIIAETWHECS